MKTNITMKTPQVNVEVSAPALKDADCLILSINDAAYKGGFSLTLQPSQEEVLQLISDLIYASNYHFKGSPKISLEVE